jgi:flagellar hook assembly protein FlgD
MPASLVFEAPRPNPSQGRVSLRLSLARPAPLRVTVLDVAGRACRTLLEGSAPAGPRSIEWDGRDADGQIVRPGVYYLRAESDAESVVRKIIRLR